MSMENKMKRNILMDEIILNVTKFDVVKSLEKAGIEPNDDNIDMYNRYRTKIANLLQEDVGYYLDQVITGEIDYLVGEDTDKLICPKCQDANVSTSFIEYDDNNGLTEVRECDYCECRYEVEFDMKSIKMKS